MTYIPQEAKEQIATLMSNVEKLENQKKELIHQVSERNREKENNKTVIIVLGGILAILIVFIGYTYVFGPIFGEYKTKIANSELLASNVETLEKENGEFQLEIDNLNLLIKEASENNNIVLNSDLIFRVQIGAFKKFKMGMYSGDMASVLEKNEKGFNKYSLGVFDNYKDALKFKKEVKRMGVRSAFLLAEYKGKNINIKKAIALEKK